jgi:hypothetical protein|tara:strand:- start:1563 stop:1814 length:252 start_codon:yes stop_codon:yes gene_type:complete
MDNTCKYCNLAVGQYQDICDNTACNKADTVEMELNNFILYITHTNRTMAKDLPYTTTPEKLYQQVEEFMTQVYECVKEEENNG